MAKISLQFLFKTMAVVAMILVLLQYVFYPKRSGRGVLYFDENNNAHRKESLFYFVKKSNSNVSRVPSTNPWLMDELETISPLVLSLDQSIAYGKGSSLTGGMSSGTKSINVTVESVPTNSNTSLSDSPSVSSNKSISGDHVLNGTVNSTVSTSTALPICPMPPPTLIGFVRVQLKAPSLSEIASMNPDLELGGHYKPKGCKSKDRVAIILPFRDRQEHLRTFLYNIHPFLQRQQIEYNIYVIEQGGNSKSEPFNRGMLFNVGFREAGKRFPYDCYIFHDVDLIPENDYNLYNCPQQPRHMSVAVDKMKYQLPYKTLFGGIAALTKEHFEKVNGFSNMFWGWGGEDDDFSGRVAYKGLFVSRRPSDVARYKMLKHEQQKVNTKRFRMLQRGKRRFSTDGLSNLDYTVEKIVLEKTYTLIRVELARIGL